MSSNRFAFAALATACITAAGVGGYLASRSTCDTRGRAGGDCTGGVSRVARDVSRVVFGSHDPAGSGIRSCRVEHFRAYR